jgi:hypothetical protein
LIPIVQWIYLVNPDAGENRERILQELDKENNGTIGKYIFFSDDKWKLVDLGKKILASFNLYIAKLPASSTPRPILGKGFVLCIYDYSPKYVKEISNHEVDEEITFDSWKTDADTLLNVIQE